MSKIKLLIPTLLLSVLLVACNQDDTVKPSKTDMEEDKQYELVWMELVNNGNSESLTYQISYMDGKNQENIRVKSKDIIERIHTDSKDKATIKNDGDTFIIYRQPLNILYSEELKGTVESKDVSK
ncbi:hypothetical protein [Staphylococcus phage PMBT8]|nr:hypothetical protein [Staphylococcus phage PMBT8]